MKLGRQSKSQYDAAGRATQALGPDPVSGNITANSSLTLATYVANGNPLSIVDPNGSRGDSTVQSEHTTTFAYDSRNRLITTTSPATFNYWASGASPIYAVVSRTYDPAGNVLTVTDPRGFVSATLYDSANRPTYSFSPPVDYVSSNGTVASASLVSAQVYDQNGNLIESHSGVAADQSPSLVAYERRSVLNVYDSLNHLLWSEDAMGSVSRNSYDEAGNRIAVMDANNQTTTFSYDGLGRLLATTYPGNFVATSAYGAVNLLSRTDASGHQTTYAYDARNRVTSITNQSAPATVDASGHSLPVYVSQGRVLHYDNAGELVAIAENFTNNSTVSNAAYAYDGIGRVVAENQGAAFNGAWSPNTFGSLPGNLSTNSTNGVTNTFSYDSAGNGLTATYASGRSDASTLTSTYDALNRLSSVTDDSSRETDYYYDAAGNCVEFIQGSGGPVWKTYDELNRPISIIGNDPFLTRTLYDYTLQYDEFGNLRSQEESYPDGQISNRTVTMNYDGANRLVAEAIGVAADGAHGGSPTQSVRSLNYDPADNRIGEFVTLAIGAGNASTVANLTFNYRADNALLQASGTSNGTAFTMNYSVDADGRQTSSNLTTNGTTFFAKDSFSYDFENRVIQRLSGNHTTDIAIGSPGIYHDATTVEDNIYDFRGRQIAQFQDLGQKTTRNFGGSVVSNTTTAVDHAWRLYSGGTAQREYGLGNNTAWALNLTAANLTVQYVRGSDMGGGVGGVLYDLRPSGNSTIPSYFHYDCRGDVVAQTNADGNLTYQAAYTAEGQHNPGAFLSNVLSSLGLQPGSFGAEEWDPAAYDNGHNVQTNSKREEYDGQMGYVNDGQRYRDLFSGRFLTKDPAGCVDGLNQFAYCRQNPWSAFDPDGLATLSSLRQDVRSQNRIIGQARAGGLFARGVMASLRKTDYEEEIDHIIAVTERFNYWAEVRHETDRLDENKLNDNGSDPIYNAANTFYLLTEGISAGVTTLSGSALGLFADVVELAASARSDAAAADTLIAEVAAPATENALVARAETAVTIPAAAEGAVALPETARSTVTPVVELQQDIEAALSIDDERGTSKLTNSQSFTSVNNQSGGKIWVSENVITQNEIRPLVKSLKNDGRITILSRITW